MADAALEAKLLLPEPFNGSGDIQAYVTQFELLSSLQNWCKKAYESDGTTPRTDASGNQIYIDKRHQVFPLRLRGSAIEFYQSLDDATKADYKELKKQFLRQYQEPPEFFRSSLSKRVQGETEKVSEFLAELKLLAAKAYPGGSPDVQSHIVLQAFIDGLYNANVRVELRKQKPANIEAALDSALHFDAVYRLEPTSAQSFLSTPTLNAVELLTQKVDQLMAGQISNTNSRSFRHHDGQRNSRSPNQRSSKDFARSSKHSSQSPRKGSANRFHSGSRSGSRENSSHRSSSRDRQVRFSGPIVCYGCNREGHLKSECKNCWNCGSSQHQRRNCPKDRKSSYQ